MRNILEDIYYGRLVMHENTFRHGSKCAEALFVVSNLWVGFFWSIIRQ